MKDESRGVIYRALVENQNQVNWTTRQRNYGLGM